MTLDEWRERMGWSRAKTYKTLGIGPNRWRRMEQCKQPIPNYISLALTALLHGDRGIINEYNRPEPD